MTAPQDPYSYPGAPGGPTPRSGSQVFSYVAIACGIIAILLLPIIFGPLGIIFAVVANRRGEPLWKVALGVAIGGMILGFILGALVLAAD